MYTTDLQLKLNMLPTVINLYNFVFSLKTSNIAKLPISGEDYRTKIKTIYTKIQKLLWKTS